MKFLIPTQPDDSHAIIVRLALEKMGHQVRFLFTADLPTKQRNSVFIDNNHYEWKSTDNFDSYTDNDYDVVWWRRVRKPFLMKDSIHPKDYKFVVRENTLFHESLTYNMSPNAWWINKKEAATRANSKLYQLKVANACGLQIPTTLVSNDPKDIRYFLLKHDDQGVIYKPFNSNFWFEDKAIKISYTSKIRFLDLPDNNALQLTPGIYQKEIKKKYELRVTYFGEYLVAAKLNSQSHQDGLIDWRAIPEGKMAIEPYKLPEDLEHKIRLFMHKMGLVFGSLDFIVTMDDEYIFLEVNEQGQFLWIEDYNPQFNMLDIFINFIINGNRPFNYDLKQCIHKVADYDEKASEIAMHYKRHHIDLNSAKAQTI